MKTITPPTAAPVTLEELRAQLRLDGLDEDALLAGYLDAAVAHVEAMTSLLLMPQTVAWEFDCFTELVPPLSRGPIRSVTITYEDEAGEVQTVDPSIYRLRDRGGIARIRLATGACWPAGAPDSVVTVTAEAGYPDAETVPVALRQAILFLAAHFYENRTPVGAASSSAELPLTFRHLVEPHRLWLI